MTGEERRDKPMNDSVIDLLCDGDLHSRHSQILMRQYFTVGDLETLAALKEKAAATNSDQRNVNQ